MKNVTAILENTFIARRIPGCIRNHVRSVFSSSLGFLAFKEQIRFQASVRRG